MKVLRTGTTVNIVFIMLVSSLFIGTHARSEILADSDEWTIAVYGDVDDTQLEDAWDRYTSPALLGIPANEKISVVAAVDRFAISGTELIEYSGGVATVVDTEPEQNFGHPDTLKWFIQTVTLSYPSHHLAVMLWDHGGGWHGVCWDDTDDDHLTIDEVSTGISTAGTYIDILGFDCCMMASIEVVYEVYTTGLVGVVVGSEGQAPYTGYPYDLMFSPLAADPYLTKEEVAEDMVQGWDEYYSTGQGKGMINWIDLQAVSVTVLGGVVLNEFKTWMNAMQADVDKYWKEYLRAFRDSEMVVDYYNVDIERFVEYLLTDRHITDQELKDASIGLMSAVDIGIVSQSWGSTGPLAGITLWFGLGHEYEDYGLTYSDTAFAIETGWGSFLALVNSYWK
ncbi:MAG: hypothetical protein JSV94_05955 [Methanobacteriota archaeon]|nr:MAG: hypothetical protein JSV94_05955 [Euryarchaeota archaeon]